MANGIFQQIVAGEQARQRGQEQFAQNIGQQFASGIFEGREQRRLEDAALTQAEAKLDFLSQQEGFDPSIMEQFASAKRPEDKLAIASTAETMFGLQQQQAAADLEQRNIESQIALRKAQAAGAGQTSAPNLSFQTVLKDGVPTKVGIDPKTGEEKVVVGQSQEVPRGVLSPSEQAQAETAKERAKIAVKSNQALVDVGRAAANTIRSNQRALEILESGALDTGILADVKTSALKIAKDLGIELAQEDLDQITNAEEFRARTIDQVLEKIQQTKGAISERENEMFQNASATLRNTVEGNKAILRFAIAKAEKEREVERLITRMRRDKASAEEIDIAVSDFINDPENDISGSLSGMSPDGAEQAPLQSPADVASAAISDPSVPSGTIIRDAQGNILGRKP